MNEPIAITAVWLRSAAYASGTVEVLVEAREQNLLDNKAIDALCDELKVSGAQAARIYVMFRDAILAAAICHRETK